MSSPVLSDSSPPYTEALESLSSERTRLGILIITRTFTKHEQRSNNTLRVFQLVDLVITRKTIEKESEIALELKANYIRF